jgi:hypothetical protein
MTAVIGSGGGDITQTPFRYLAACCLTYSLSQNRSVLRPTTAAKSLLRLKIYG